MIKVNKIYSNNIGSPERMLSKEELKSVTSVLCNEFEYIYYQGDEPVNNNIQAVVNDANWVGLQSGLIMSKAFIRAIQNPSIVNQVAHGALQSVLSTEGSEADLKAMLQYTMTYSEDEKAEINKLLSDNYFTIQL